MIAGRMTERLTILRPAETPDDGFSSAPAPSDWEETVTVHAERVKDSGRRSDELGEHFSAYSTEYNIRDAHVIRENWRVQEVGGYLYTVCAILRNRRRGMLTLVCERVNL